MRRSTSGIAPTSCSAPSFEGFFSHLFSIYGRGESKIIAGIRRAVAQAGGAEAFLNDILTPLAEAYHRVLHAADVEISIDPEARRYLVYLGRLAGRRLGSGRHARAAPICR